MPDILEIENLRKEYSDFVLDNISFRLPRGYIMGLIGPNGAGKTTTIKLILNLIRRDGGNIRIFGLDSLRHEKEVKEKVGFVHDAGPYFDDLTAKETGFLMQYFYRDWEHSTFRRFLNDFGLPTTKKIKEYSRGMRSKFALAVALSHQAEFIVLDEPTSGLDPVFREEILEILASVIQNEGRAVLFSSHITSDLEKIADYVTYINRGRIVFSENKDDVLKRFFVVRGPKSDLNPDFEAQLLGLRRAAYGFEGLCSEMEAIRPRLTAQCIVEKATLDQIMIHVARNEQNVN